MVIPLQYLVFIVSLIVSTLRTLEHIFLLSIQHRRKIGVWLPSVHELCEFDGYYTKLPEPDSENDLARLKGKI